MKKKVTDPVADTALTLLCETCAAMPGQACRKTWEASVHLNRYNAALVEMGLPVARRKSA